MTRELHVYGLSEDALAHRLADLPQYGTGVTFSVCGCFGTVTLSAEEDLSALAEAVLQRLTGYVYSEGDPSLAAAVVGLLATHGLTVATAESCTGGQIAAALTDVPGASRVFGTGVVSYSNACKEALLGVTAETLAEQGAVSAATAGQMARGVRQKAEATLGLAATGEAGPVAAEAHPVGTVFIALADGKRTWTEQLHLEGDREAIRRAATDGVLWLLWRYLSAYPAVMAGGETHRAAQKREIPRTKGGKQPRLVSRLLPWRGDTRRVLCIKAVAWLAVLAVLIGCLWAGYTYLVEPNRNRQLQESLGELYYDATDLTEGVEGDSDYPAGMMAVFRGLYQRNSDVGGWIHIPDTGVDYPVMHYAEGYYRNHNFGKEYSLYGQPYFDRLFSVSHPQIYAVHGRNTGDGQMFSALLNYRRVAYLQEHAVIELNTLQENIRWQIFAVAVLDSRDTDHFNLQEQPKDYDVFLDSLLRRSLFLSDMEVTGEDSLLLLTTNAQREYGFSGAQLVVAASRIEGEPQEVTYRVNNRALMPAVLSGTTTRTTRTTTTATGVVTTQPTNGADGDTDVTGPTDPTESTDPMEPTDPTASTDATDPTASTDATDPTESTDSAESTSSTEPTDPTEPTTKPTDEPDDTNGEDDDYIGN